MNLFGSSLLNLKEYLKARGLKPFSAAQIYDWMYVKKVWDISLWTNISKVAREDLIQNNNLDLPQIIWNGLSKDGTLKFLLKMSDGNTIETVVIPGANRRTICISSQVGCAIGCKFCHTGTQGLTRHLKTEEIVGQFMVVNQWLLENDFTKITNIVYMGQGEPLHNFENVKEATQIFLEQIGLCLSQRKVTLSTSGLVPQVKKLSEFPPVNIAISLHSARNKVRSSLMPINNTYDLKRLFEAIKEIPLKASRRITYEYILIAGVNDLDEDVEALTNLLIKKESKINIIPFNEYPDSPYKRPSDESIASFSKKLLDRGFICTIRASKGDDILAACGQLKSEHEKLNLWGADNQRKIEEQKESSTYR